jgi:flavin reductase (DIM6/NTAB) family NADH-FMN oxidoreductase RutF
VNLPATDELDGATLRRVFGAFPTGVTSLAAVVDGTPVGLAANSFTSVSLEPPLVSVCVAVTSETWPVLRTAKRIGVSVLGDDHAQASRQLAARGVDRFDGLDWYTNDDGAIFLTRTTAWLDCSIDREIRAGDHDIIVLAVHRLGIDTAVAPLVFHGSRFHGLRDLNAPQSAEQVLSAEKIGRKYS